MAGHNGNTRRGEWSGAKHVDDGINQEDVLAEIGKEVRFLQGTRIGMGKLRSSLIKLVRVVSVGAARWRVDRVIGCAIVGLGDDAFETRGLKRGTFVPDTAVRRIVGCAGVGSSEIRVVVVALIIDFRHAAVHHAGTDKLEYEGVDHRRRSKRDKDPKIMEAKTQVLVDTSSCVSKAISMPTPSEILRLWIGNSRADPTPRSGPSVQLCMSRANNTHTHYRHDIHKNPKQEDDGIKRHRRDLSILDNGKVSVCRNGHDEHGARQIANRDEPALSPANA